MCGRYYIDINDLEYQRIVDALAQLPKSGEIFPTDTVPALSSAGLSLMQWGFPRYDGKGVVINARAETVTAKPMFAGPFAALRCLLPASFYYEWKKEGTKRIKYRMSLPGSPVLYLAGVARNYGNGQPPAFVILTRPAAAGIAFVHERMPLILPPDALEAWLHDNQSEAASVMNAAEIKVEAKPAEPIKPV